MKTAAAFLLLVSILVLSACSRREPTAADSASGAGHHHRAPHGGQLVELGDHQFNLEFKYDMARGMLQVWVLDGHAENFIRAGMTLFDVQEVGGLQRTISLRAVANEMTGEKPGDTSAFEGEARWLGEVGHFDGVVKAIRIRDTDFRDIKFHFHPRE